MAGSSWGKKTDRGLINEKWKAINDSSFEGESLMIRANGETKLLETIELVFRDKNYYYMSTAQGQNDNKPVKFIITSHNESGFVAENPEHDFPKRITYRLINNDSIHAFIDGGSFMAGKNPISIIQEKKIRIWQSLTGAGLRFVSILKTFRRKNCIGHGRQEMELSIGFCV